MKERDDFLKKSNAEALIKKHEQDAADGLDYLGNERDIKQAISDLEIRLQLQPSNPSSWKVWVGIAALLFAGVFTYWLVPNHDFRSKEQVAMIPKVKYAPTIISNETTDSLENDSKKKTQTIVCKLPIIVEEENADKFDDLSEHSDAAMLPFQEPIAAQKDIEISAPKLAEAASDAPQAIEKQSNNTISGNQYKKLRESSSWEKTLYETHVWDGNSPLQSVNIPVSVKDGKLMLKRTKRFTDTQWNTLDSLIAPFSENEIRKGCLLLTLPLR